MWRVVLLAVSFGVSQPAAAQEGTIRILLGLLSLGVEPTGLGAQELAAIMKRDYERWGPIIKASGFKPEN